METLSSISNSDLLERMPSLVRTELARTADVIAYLVEIDRRKLYLDQACSSLFRYLTERLGYTEDEATKRIRAARLASRIPQVLQELRSGAIHLTGLFLISQHLTEENSEALLAEARGKSRRELERVIASWFPRPDVQASVTPVPGPTSGESGATRPCPGTGKFTDLPRLEPLSASSYRVEFTASAELREKIERARELLSHALPSGDLATLFERALDELIDRETRRRTGALQPRKRRQLRPGSRHVPLHVARLVWERDGCQCTFVDQQGRRCNERRFLTLEHQHPYALGGASDADNLVLLCRAHNGYTARQVFGEAHTAKKQVQRSRAKTAKRTGESQNADVALAPDVYQSVLFALRRLGFREREASKALADLRQSGVEPNTEALLRGALKLLTPRSLETCRERL